jgi:2-hydroxychromene-2-carboxylate isomerase
MVEKAQASKEQGGIATIDPAVFRRCLISKVTTRLAREARAEGVPYGNVKDPIGQPARHGYALFQWAREQNKGTAFFSNFLSAAFALGVNTNRESGLKTVVENTGLDWQQARQHLTDKNWESELEENRLTMYDSGLWGVPSFRLLDAQGNEVISAWGQDRLWLIAQHLYADSGTT